MPGLDCMGDSKKKPSKLLNLCTLCTAVCVHIVSENNFGITIPCWMDGTQFLKHTFSLQLLFIVVVVPGCLFDLEHDSHDLWYIRCIELFCLRWSWMTLLYGLLCQSIWGIKSLFLHIIWERNCFRLSSSSPQMRGKMPFFDFCAHQSSFLYAVYNSLGFP